MKGSEIYDSIVTRCLELDLDVRKFPELFYSAILCMAQTPVSTDNDIFIKYFEREAVRLGMDLWSRRPASNVEKEQYSEPDAFLEPLPFYLPKDTEVLNVHIEVYKNLTTVVLELWITYGPKAGSRELTVGNCGLTEITTYLMSDIVESVRQLHAKFSKR